MKIDNEMTIKLKYVINLDSWHRDRSVIKLLALKVKKEILPFNIDNARKMQSIFNKHVVTEMIITDNFETTIQRFS